MKMDMKKEMKTAKPGQQDHVSSFDEMTTANAIDVVEKKNLAERRESRTMDFWEKGYCIFDQVINGLIRILLAGILFLLFLHSIFSTSFIGKVAGEDGVPYERTLNISDAPWKHLVALILVPAVMAVVIMLGEKRRKRQDMAALSGQMGERSGRGRFLGALCLVTAAAGCLWIAMTQLAPGSDPAKVYTIAMQWREQNFSAFAEGGYLFRYPFQSGIILFYYFCTFLFGVNNYVGLQLVNVAALVLVYFCLAKLAGYFWKEDRRIEPAVYVGLMLWLPLFFYITYLYGILLGMGCSLLAVYMAAEYLETRKYRYMVISALAMGAATVLKMNCLIYGIAIGCFLFYDIIVSGFKEKVKSALFILLLIAGVAACNGASNRYVEQLTGYEPTGGEVMVSWVVMGLQDTPLGPGGYSGYIGDVFTKYHYDEELITEASVADIKKILKRMAENPLDVGIPFFAAKTAFQWNDPTFIGMYLNDNRQSAHVMPGLAQSVIDGRGSVWLSGVLNYMQSLIWFGALCCVIMRRKSRNLYELMGGVIFLGGYFFHFMWESSSSYTIPYFVVMIPYAVKGQLDLARGIAGIIGKKTIPWGAKTPLEKRRVAAKGAFVVMLAGLVCAFTRTGLFARTIGLDDGPGAAVQFYLGRSAVEKLNQEGGLAEQTLASGSYLISPSSDLSQILTQEGGLGSAVVTKEKGKNAIQSKTEEGGSCSPVFVSLNNGLATLRFGDTGEVLAVSEADGGAPVSYMDDSMNMFYRRDDSMKTVWRLRSAGNGAYYILTGEAALTWQDGAVLLKPFGEAAVQEWMLVPASKFAG